MWSVPLTLTLTHYDYRTLNQAVETSTTVNNSPIQDYIHSPGLWKGSWFQTFHSNQAISSVSSTDVVVYRSSKTMEIFKLSS